MNRTTVKSNFLTAVLTGIGITIAAGIVLFPVVFAMFAAFFELYVFSDPPPTAWINDLLITGTLVVWIFSATAAGGWACAEASSLSNEYSYALFLAFIWTTTILLLRFLPSVEDGSFLILLAIAAIGIAGYFTGTMLRIRKKKKTISRLNKSASPADIPSPLFAPLLQNLFLLMHK